MWADKTYWVYIMTNTRRGVLYVGVTSDIVTRTQQHREGAHPGFTREWGLKRLVWYEAFDEPSYAIAHEKRLKRWLRGWKFELIEQRNPDWNDLWVELTSVPPEAIETDLSHLVALPAVPALRSAPDWRPELLCGRDDTQK